MYADQLIEEVLFTEEEIIQRSKELGEQLTQDYKDNDNEVLFVGLLRGSVPFMAELIKHIDMPVRIDFMAVSSYEGTESTGDIKINMDLSTSIKDMDIILVEDIVDTGTTIHRVKELLYNKGARSVKVVALLDKPSRREADIIPDYVGYTIPNKFVVGFGLDFNQEYRNLPFIGVLKPEVYEGLL